MKSLHSDINILPVLKEHPKELSGEKVSFVVLNINIHKLEE